MSEPTANNKTIWIVVSLLCCLLSCGGGFMCGATLNELGNQQLQNR